jgi:hypothetical protein
MGGACPAFSCSHAATLLVPRTSSALVEPVRQIGRSWFNSLSACRYMADGRYAKMVGVLLRLAYLGMANAFAMLHLLPVKTGTRMLRSWPRVTRSWCCNASWASGRPVRARRPGVLGRAAALPTDGPATSGAAAGPP